METTQSEQAPAYPAPLDVVVLAGTDDNPRRMIRGQNKAFLEIGGRVLVCRVVEALLEAESIGQVYVVGPSERLQHALEGLPEGQAGRVTVVEQAGKMLANAWAAIRASEGRYRQAHGQDDPQRPLLFISSDLPLVSTAAIDDYVARCAAEDHGRAKGFSLLAGVAEEASLRSFYPDENGPGIVRPYVHFSNCRLRLANIYVGRPRTLDGPDFLQTGFEHRKAEKWKNVLALTRDFLGQPGGFRAAGITLRLQATLLAARYEGRIYRWLRRRNRLEQVERVCGRVLGGTVRIVVTPHGGLSLDVDNDEDYRVLDRRFEDWRRVGPVEPGR